MKTNLRKLTMGALTAAMTLVLFCGTVFAAPLSDGKYTITATALKNDGTVAANANGAITNPVTLEVSGGTIYAFVEIKDSMINLTANGAAATQVSSAGGKITWKFPVTDLSTSIPVTTVVPAMGNSTQSFNLAFDSSTVVNITPQTPAPSPDNNANQTTDTNTNTTPAPQKVSNPKTADSGFEVLGAVVLAACLLSAGALGVNKVRAREN